MYLKKRYRRYEPRRRRGRAASQLHQAERTIYTIDSAGDAARGRGRYVVRSTERRCNAGACCPAGGSAVLLQPTRRHSTAAPNTLRQSRCARLASLLHGPDGVSGSPASRGRWTLEVMITLVPVVCSLSYLHRSSDGRPQLRCASPLPRSHASVPLRQ
eukprot:SAG31_NODE_4340_length_3340_cov_3.282012_3_plen_158_part_00